MNQQILSVSDLNLYLKDVFDQDELLSEVSVLGEISNYKIYPSGHHYFTLKDKDASLSCVLFKGSAYSLRFHPENGLQIIATGRVSVYPRDGKYQLICRNLMPAGMGDLQLAFEQIKRKLNEEGLFDESHKKQIPVFPKRIAVITSEAGAAVHDILKILNARWPMSSVLLVPTRVQGEEAPGEIVRAIQLVNALNCADLIICGRGGGSVEDLWAYNSEVVARAVYASEIPVISAVGHEPDITIIDYVADLRAATPSNAAELAVPNAKDIRENLHFLAKRLHTLQEHRLLQMRRMLMMLQNRKVLQDSMETTHLLRIHLDGLSASILHMEEVFLKSKRSAIAAFAASLDALSPLKVLQRGYSFAKNTQGNVISSVSQIAVKEHFLLYLSDGTAECSVDSINREEL